MIADTPCPDDTALRALVLGLQDAAADPGLEAHFACCPRCVQRAAATFEADDHLVRAIQHAGAGPVVEVPAGILDRLRQLRPETVADDTTPQEQRVGPYRLESELGRGGMGVVYLARHDRLDRPVALKMLPPGASAERLDRFRREAKAVAALRHQGIIQVHEVGEAAGRPFLVMEYADGGTLARRLNAAPLSSPEAAAMLEPVARAVGYAHSVGVVHRDLKPSNVLLGKDGAPRVGDFGLVKMLGLSEHGPTETGALVGTPGYMAPEQAGGGEVGPTADVYGLGAVLYECLTGRPPFRAATPLVTLDQLRSRDPVPPSRLEPSVPRDLETVCLKCLEKSPARRYPTAEALADDLGRFLRGEPVTARPVGPARRAWKWARRRPTVAALLVVSLLAMVALVAGVMVHNARLLHEVEQTQIQAAEARRAHETSAARYHAARETLGRMLGRLDAPHLAEMPRVMELRQHLLEDALAFYQTALGHEDDPDPAIRRDSAYAYADTGAIQYLLGRSAQSGENFRMALTLLEALPNEDRDDPGCLLKRGFCHSYLGTLASDSHQYAEAERHFRTELDIDEQLTASEPGNVDWQNECARAEHHLGQLFHDTKRLPDAVIHYLRAVAIRMPLVADHPEIERYQARLAETNINLGAVYADQRRPGDSLREAEKAIALLRPLHDRHPEDIDYSLSLAGACINAGNLARDVRDAGMVADANKALVLHHQAVELTESVLRKEPTYGPARLRCFTAHGARSQTFEALGRWPEVARDLDRVCELRPEAMGSWVTRVNLASALARSGDHARAVAGAQALRTAPVLSDDGRYQLAAACAVSIEKARADSQLTPDEQKLLTERYAVEAVSLLHELHARKYFRIASNANALATDQDFAAIRGRPDFQELLRQVKTGKSE